MELLSQQGYRQDGRKANELRRIACRLGVYSQADGSAYFEQGLTKVLVAVYGPHEVKRSGGGKKANPDKCVVNCQYSMATFSTTDRKQRPRGDRKSSEWNLQLQKTFESAILTQSYPNSQIDIFCEVLQADGGNLAACINGGTLALVDAGISIRGLVSAATCGCTAETPVVDINHLEESVGTSAELTMALLPHGDEILLLEMKNRLHFDLLERVMDSAIQACKDVNAVLDAAVRNHTSTSFARLLLEGSTEI